MLITMLTILLHKLLHNEPTGTSESELGPNISFWLGNGTSGRDGDINVYINNNVGEHKIHFENLTGSNVEVNYVAFG